MYILLINNNLYKYTTEIAKSLKDKFSNVKIKNNSINNQYIRFYSELFEDIFVHEYISDLFKNLSNKYNIIPDFLLYKELTRKQTLSFI